MKSNLNPLPAGPGEPRGASASCYFPQSPCGRHCQRSCSWGEEGPASHARPTRLGPFPSTAFSSWASDSGVGTALVVQWLRRHASTAGGAGSIPGWWTKMPHAFVLWPEKKIRCDFDHSCPSPSWYHLELYLRARWVKGTFVKINTGENSISRLSGFLDVFYPGPLSFCELWWERTHKHSQMVSDETAAHSAIRFPPGFFFFFVLTLHSLWDLISPTRDWTWVLGCESAES